MLKLRKKEIKEIKDFAIEYNQLKDNRGKLAFFYSLSISTITALILNSTYFTSEKALAFSFIAGLISFVFSFSISLFTDILFRGRKSIEKEFESRNISLLSGVCELYSKKKLKKILNYFDALPKETQEKIVDLKISIFASRVQDLDNSKIINDLIRKDYLNYKDNTFSFLKKYIEAVDIEGATPSFYEIIENYIDSSETNDFKENINELIELTKNNFDIKEKNKLADLISKKIKTDDELEEANKRLDNFKQNKVKINKIIQQI